MESISALVTADFKSANGFLDSASDSKQPSLLSRILTAWRKSAANRRMRDQLAGMDDALLRDIGIAEDEILRIRGYERFTPRAWQGRSGV